jgi:hypothetical protein
MRNPAGKDLFKMSSSKVLTNSRAHTRVPGSDRELP